MFSFLDALGADFLPVAVGKSRPLEIGVAPGFACRIVFASQKVSLVGHYRSFAAGWTLFHKNMF